MLQNVRPSVVLSPSPQKSFKDAFPRYFQDFCEAVPMPLHTRPLDGPLNMHNKMALERNPTDIGPKTYIAMGRQEELGQVRAKGTGVPGQLS